MVANNSFQFKVNLPEYGLVLTGNHPERTMDNSSIEAREKACSSIKVDKKTRKLLTGLMAKKIVSKSHIESMQPVHDELIMERGTRAMTMKLLFKDIEIKKPLTMRI